MSNLNLKKLTIVRGKTHTARELSLTFEKGKIYAILGPNGAGKSTLLKAIFGDVSLRKGEIEYQDKTLHKTRLGEWRKPIGYMPQDTYVSANLTALDVVLLGKLDSLSMHLNESTLQAALKVMEKVGCLDLAQRDIQSLSGGQRQLILFAQVLLGSPDILMLDEPVSALDMYHQSVLLEHVYQETKKRDLITIMVIHDLSLAAQYADELILLKNGTIRAQGSPSKVLTPDKVAEVYKVDIERLFDSNGTPVIQPKRTSSAHY